MLNFFTLMRIGIELPRYNDGEDGGIASIKINGILLDWSWYPIHFDLKRMVFYGLVQGYENEMGFFSLWEILQAGLYVDKTYTPKLVGELLNER